MKRKVSDSAQRSGDSKRLTELGLLIFDSLKHAHGLSRSVRPLVEPAVQRLTDSKSRPAGEWSPWQRRLIRLAVQWADPAGGEAASVLKKARSLPPAALSEAALRLAAVLRLAAGVSGLGASAGGMPDVVDDGKTFSVRLRSRRRLSPAATQAVSASCGLWNAVMARPARIEPRPSRRVPHEGRILPSDTTAQAGCRVLQRQMEMFTSRAYGLGILDDVEYVHEMRVATRRLRAALRVFRAGIGDRLEPVREELARVARLFGVARDADVLLAFLKRYAAKAPPSHQPFLLGLVRCERAGRLRAYRAARSELASLRFAKARAHFLGFVSASCEASAPPPLVAHEAPRMLRKALDRVARYDRAISDYPGDRQHALRIACKRLRYAAEYFAPVYRGGLKELIEAVTRMQSLLGDMHDADVYEDRVRRYAASRRGKRAGLSAEKALGALLRQFRERRARRMDEADKVWRKFLRARNQERFRKTLRKPVSYEKELR